MKTFHILTPTAIDTSSNTPFDVLPDEDAYNLIAGIRDNATAAEKPFNLYKLDRERHPRGLCIGKTSTDKPISIFYLSDIGEYGWIETSRLRVEPSFQCKHWTRIDIALGMLYWFRKSAAYPNDIRAEPVGTAGPLVSAYAALLALPGISRTPKNNNKGDDETNCANELRPQFSEPQFEPLKSLDELGL